MDPLKLSEMQVELRVAMQKIQELERLLVEKEAIIVKLQNQQ